MGVCFLFFLAAQTTRQISDFWVRWWVSDEYNKFANKKVQQASATEFYSLIYLLLVGLFYTMMLFRGATFLWWVLRSSEGLRRRALHNVLHAPMGFFLVTPVGDLLLNFTKDQVRRGAEIQGRLAGRDRNLTDRGCRGGRREGARLGS